MSVSLSSVLSSYGYGSTSTATTKTDATSSSAAVQAAIKTLNAAATTSTTTNTSGTQVSISAEALAAAAAKADNDKDFGALATEVRTALDAQYASGTDKGTPDLSGLSGRALAAIALNKDDKFSSAERYAAKAALREETRDSFVSYGGLSAIGTFSAKLAEQYDAMSPEERTARGWTEDFRDANADFATKSTEEMPSLFDQLWK